MSFLPIYKTLKDDASFSSLVSVDRQLYEDVAPIGTAPPYIVWQTLGGQANNHLDCAANFDDTQYQIMVYAATKKQAYELRDAVRRALEDKSWINNPSINYYDHPTKLFARGFDANWILER